MLREYFIVILWPCSANLYIFDEFNILFKHCYHLVYKKKIHIIFYQLCKCNHVLVVLTTIQLL